MLKITNKQRHPVQIIIRSKTAQRSMSVKNIPGIGAGHNVYYLEDERVTDYISDLEKRGWIDTAYVANK